MDYHMFQRKYLTWMLKEASSNVLYYGSLSLETILWLTFDGNHIFFKKMVSQSKNGFPKYGFSIKKWFPKIWFLNQKMVSQNMVSQSKNGFPKYGFSIKKWFPKIWFLNQKMVSQNMVSQSKNGFPKYGFSIKKWKTIYFSKKWFH